MSHTKRVESSAFQLTVLGTRGSAAVSRADCMYFGGNTSCYMVQAGDETIFLDAGSGLLLAPTAFRKTPVILISHYHLDHIQGLGMYSRLAQKGLETVLYLPACDAEQGKTLIDGVFSPPYWPLSLSEYAGTLSIRPFPDKLTIGEVVVDTLHGNHPGDSLVIKLQYRDRTLVYATDYEACEPDFTNLVEFAYGADLVLFDGQYTEEEYQSKIGFGHSSYVAGMELVIRGQVKRMLIVHHDPQSTDRELRRREELIQDHRIHFAREGETVSI